MNRLTVQTRFGPLPVVGRLHAGRRRATLLAVGGAFPPADYLHDLVDKHPNDNVIVGCLPGMRSPSFDSHLPASYSAAFDELIGVLLPTQPIVAYGVSTGCLVTLGLRAPNIVRHIAQEPFFNTRDLWPFQAYAQEKLTANPDNKPLAEFLASIFGIRPGAVGNVDYEHLAHGIRIPTDAIVAKTPLLPMRALDYWPSLTSAHDRDLLRANGMVRIHQAAEDSGHNIVVNATGERFVHELRANALAEAAALELAVGRAQHDHAIPRDP
jgi:hypothetical protein